MALRAKAAQHKNHLIAHRPGWLRSITRPDITSAAALFFFPNIRWVCHQSPVKVCRNINALTSTLFAAALPSFIVSLCFLSAYYSLTPYLHISIVFINHSELWSELWNRAVKNKESYMHREHEGGFLYDREETWLCLSDTEWTLEVFRILHMYFYSCCPFSLLLLQAGSSGAGRNANNFVFPPYFHAGVSCAEYFLSIVICVFRHKREVEQSEYLQDAVIWPNSLMTVTIWT